MSGLLGFSGVPEGSASPASCMARSSSPQCNSACARTQAVIRIGASAGEGRMRCAKLGGFDPGRAATSGPGAPSRGERITIAVLGAGIAGSVAG
jgi:hypothetical protein